MSFSRGRSEFRLPAINEWQLNLFAGYTGFYFRRHFHGVHLLRQFDTASLDTWPLLICLNHPAWWDPLFGLYLSKKVLTGRTHYSPIASEGLAKYRFFEKLGFFGIDPHARRGAVCFLQFGQAVLNSNRGAFWVTVEGQFTDVRRRPVQLQPGVGHLAHHCRRFAMVPLALEYAFWNERSPEAFACLGEPVFVTDGKTHTADEWLKVFADALQSAQDSLAREVIRRDERAFETLLTGSAGVGGVYDVWRAMKAFLTGTKFHREHESR